MQNKIATLPSSLLTPPEQDCDRDTWSGTRQWKVTISYKTEVFINDKEKEYFLAQLANGKRIIKVGEMVLTNKFLSITKVR
jgi:hypothetical protein